MVWTVWVLLGGGGKAIGSHTNTRKERGGKKPFIPFVEIDHEDFFWRNFGGLIYQSGQPI